MASLAAVDSNGVSQQVIDKVERFRELLYEDTTRPIPERLTLTLNMTVHQRDAEYIVECLRLLLHEEHIAQRTTLSLDDGGISDEAVDVFGAFLRETPCHLQAFWLWNLPPRQVRQLLAALKTNTSVKDLCIHRLEDNGASWIVDLLRHKTNFIEFSLLECCFPYTQILPLLRGQLNLKSLSFDDCRISCNGLLLFDDPESTQLFVDNILLSPRTTLKELHVVECGVTMENRPLMAGFHKNTTVVQLIGDHDGATRLFIDPILRRNRYLGFVRNILGTRTSTTTMLQPTLTTPTIPPPCGLWATVLAKVGQGTQGASLVLTILSDRLATWIEPSARFGNQNELEQQQRAGLSRGTTQKGTTPGSTFRQHTYTWRLIVCDSLKNLAGAKTFNPGLLLHSTDILTTAMVLTTYMENAIGLSGQCHIFDFCELPWVFSPCCSSRLSHLRMGYIFTVENYL